MLGRTQTTLYGLPRRYMQFPRRHAWNYNFT
jgi:hypothetical protein